MPNAAPSTDVPSGAALALAADFIREPVVLGDEDPSVALAPGTARRRAIDQALAEQAEGLPAPSTSWRRRWSLLLGLERMLSVDEPILADGSTTLGPHQVDALSGTLTALLTENQGRGPAFDDDDEAPAPRNGRNGPKAAKANGSAKPNASAKAAGSKPTATPSPLDGVGPAPSAEAAKPAASLRNAPAEVSHPVDQTLPADPDSEFDDEDEDDEEVDATGEGSDVHGVTAEELAVTDDELAELDALDLDADAEPFDSEDADQLDEQEEDPNAAKRFWFEHATGAGKTVAAMGFVDACRLGGVLILTHRRNLVDQFIDEIKTRGYKDRLSPPLLKGEDPVSERNTLGPVTVETYQWFVRHAGDISSAYTIVICDEAHTALGEKTSAAIRQWTGPIFIGMTATGALIARHVADLFPTQTSRFDLAQAARRGVIAPLRCVRIPPGVGVRTIAKVPLRKGEVDVEFDQEMLAEVLDQLPFNLAAADLYKTRFNGMAGVVYAAGVKHAYNLADAFNEFGIKAKAVSGETPKRELSRTLADYEAGKIDVLINAQLLAEGWNSPRATVCLHLAPTASKRIYQQRVGRVTRREPGKEAGLVVDFVHPATKHDDPVVTLHSLLERDVYRGGAIVVGPVRRGRGRKVRVERRVLPVASDEATRVEIFKRELWRIAVEYLDYGEQVQWAALAGASVSSANWRKARAMLHFDRGGELKRAFLVTAIKRNPSQAVKLKAVQDIAALRDPEAFADAVDQVIGWNKADRRDAVRVLLQSIADKPVGRRDQATAWIWQLAEATADEHEEYATQRWKDGKRLLGLLVNSAGPAHGRNARRLVQATREQDRRLQSAMLAAARPHTPESQQVITGARTRLARKPGALARELLRNIPKAGSPTGGGPSASINAKKRGAEDAAVVEPIDTGDAIATVGDGSNANTNGHASSATDATSLDAGNSATGATQAPAPEKKNGITRHVITDDLDAWTFESEAAEHAAEHGEGGGSGKKSRRNRGRNRGRNKRGSGNGGANGQQGKAGAQTKNGGAKGNAKNGNAKGVAKTNGQAPAAGAADGEGNGEGAPSPRRRNRGRSRRNRGEQNGGEGAVATAPAKSDGASASASSSSSSSSNQPSRRNRGANGNSGSTKAEDPSLVKSSIAAAAAALMGDAPKPASKTKAKPATKATAEGKPATARATAAKKPATPRATATKTTAPKTTATKTTAAKKPATPRATAAKPAAAKTPAAKPATRKTATASTAAAADKPKTPRARKAPAAKPAAPKAPPQTQ